MRKKVEFVLFAVVGLLAIALMAIGCGNRLSENEACGLAREDVEKALIRDENISKHSILSHKNSSIKNHNCTDFSSKIDEGWAKIKIKYTYQETRRKVSGCGLRPCEYQWVPHIRTPERMFFFTRTDQGWEISR